VGAAFTEPEQSALPLSEGGMVDRGRAEAALAEFMAAHPDAAEWTPEQCAELDRLVNATRESRASSREAEALLKGKGWTLEYARKMAVAGWLRRLHRARDAMSAGSASGRWRLPR
jgi:hypothetical protein